MKNKKTELLHFFLSKANEESQDILPIISTEDNGSNQDQPIPDIISILPIRNTVLFPGIIIPITVNRQRSIKLVKKAYKTDRIVGVVTQSSSTTDEPGTEDIYKVGTVAKIIKMLTLPDGNTTIIIQGSKKFQIEKFIDEDPFLTAKITLVEEKPYDRDKPEAKALIQSLKDAAFKILKLNPEIPQEARIALDNIENPDFLTHFLSSNINVDVADKQKLLELNSGYERGTILLEYMMKDIQLLELKQEIQNKVHSDLDQQQRDYYLRQQIKVLQDELGHDGNQKEIEDLKEKAKHKKWAEPVQKHFKKEVEKLERMNPAAAEYPVHFNYLELLIDLPWNEYTEDNFDLKRAQKILDKDHYGMEKVKDRIMEHLAVLKLKKDLKSPILCLYGPPGVGKTSLGKSIAKALNRKYIRVSLGGLHDEAEIRGHRKTYVGAMPGKIIQNIKRAGSSNPIFILDEIDKIASDFRGDPSSALLEVLDPEQNHSFMDNYLDQAYDLSKVLFIATTNSLETIQPALRDRMEIIELTGYTLEEKLEIAKKHLIPKQIEENGLTPKDIAFEKEAIIKLIEDYTRESGVRSLERKIGSVVRRLAKAKALDEKYAKKIGTKELTNILGAEIFDKELYEGNQQAGIVTGLAWTPVGGEILLIETSVSKGKGKLTLSGQLGDVMKESAMTALSYLRAHANELSIDPLIFDHYDLHIHVPAGAIPKDGPSAGITMLTSLASIYTQRKVKPKLAMTGEITLRGKVLPVGGIKEKILAAKRAGIEEIILCKKNKKDIKEMKSEYTKKLTIHYIETVNDVLKIALLKEKVRKPIDFNIPPVEDLKKRKNN
jgi:ATP-dependent Lon protease